jgi:hypothetical protein
MDHPSTPYHPVAARLNPQKTPIKPYTYTWSGDVPTDWEVGERCTVVHGPHRCYRSTRSRAVSLCPRARSVCTRDFVLVHNFPDVFLSSCSMSLTSARLPSVEIFELDRLTGAVSGMKIPQRAGEWIVATRTGHTFECGVIYPYVLQGFV